MKFKYATLGISLVIMAQIAMAGTNGIGFYWTKSGLCGKYIKDSKTLIEYVDAKRCEESQGSVFAWSKSGACAKYTKENKKFIEFVENFNCEKK